MVYCVVMLLGLGWICVNFDFEFVLGLIPVFWLVGFDCGFCWLFVDLGCVFMPFCGCFRCFAVCWMFVCCDCGDLSRLDVGFGCCPELCCFL